MEKFKGNGFEFIIINEKDMNSFSVEYNDELDNDWFEARYRDFMGLNYIECEKKDLKLVIYYDRIFGTIFIGTILKKFYDRGKYQDDGLYYSDNRGYQIHQDELVKKFIKYLRKEKLNNLEI
jgi:hypothetical protein